MHRIALLAAVVALEQAGFPGKAHAAYEAALGKWPDNLTALSNLAQVPADEGGFAEAQLAVRRALDLDGPNKAGPKGRWTIIRQKLGHIQNDDDSGTASSR